MKRVDNANMKWDITRSHRPPVSVKVWLLMQIVEWHCCAKGEISIHNSFDNGLLTQTSVPRETVMILTQVVHNGPVVD